ncbi:unnamed protein product [Timema podura]|uniref:Uncharacterized protein n=1 Tax=Timema podura TaxID=61482 RepID=A0ABN7PUA4_TIMPD|nr:unnamed protein product [Timema podura]
MNFISYLLVWFVNLVGKGLSLDISMFWFILVKCLFFIFVNIVRSSQSKPC